MKENVCKETGGVLVPLVDFNKCEAKGPCIDVCPYDVFTMQKISKEDYSSLTFLGKIKTIVHGSKKVYVLKPMECHSCGLCVSACPEKAIKLVRMKEM